MHLNNAFNILRIANILNLAYKTIDKKSRKSIIAKVNYNEKKTIDLNNF